MRIAIISGSQRPNSQSSKIAYRTESILSHEFEDIQTFVLDLGSTPLPLWGDVDAFNGRSGFADVAGIRSEMNEAEGFVIVSPEWNGMAPASLKNFFLICDGHELADKPALLIAVSSGHGGAYVIAELRVSSHKNTRICYVPEQIIIHGVEGLFNHGRGATSPVEVAVQARLTYSLRLLIEYAKALRLVRRSCVRDFDSYPYGM